MGFLRSFATCAFILALPIAIATTNIRILANAPAVYDYAFDRYDAGDSTALSRSDLDATAAALRSYFNNDETTFYQTVTEGGLQGPVFNARETRHMEDVKRLFVWVNRIEMASVVYLLLYVVAFFIWGRDGDVRQLAQQSLAGLGLGALVLGGVGVVAAFGFDAAFTHFHQLFFSNDLWQLDPRTDHLVQMFPEAFWRDVTVMLGAMCAVEAALIGAVSGIYLLGARNPRSNASAGLAVQGHGTEAA